MKIKTFPGFFIFFLSACSIIIPATPEISTSELTQLPSETLRPAEATQIQPDVQQEPPTLVFAPTTTPLPEKLPPLSKIKDSSFSSLIPRDWKPTTQPITGYELPVNWDQVINREVTDGLTFSQRDFLIKNGFVIIHSQEDQFSDIRLRTSLQYGQPYFLTTDSAHHALHLALDELLIYLEQEEIFPRLEEITRATLDEVLSYLPIVEDTPFEEEVLMAAAYLSVAMKLLDPDYPIHDSITDRVNAQIIQILSAKGGASSTLIPGYEDDFSIYNPDGHYKRTERLENYYRAITWLSRAKFKMSTSERGFVPSRAPLILTLALRHAQSEKGAVAQSWMDLYETLSYFSGAVVNISPVEYSDLMDQVYGSDATIISVMQNELWEIFQATYQGLPPVDKKISFGSPLLENKNERGWSFIGERTNQDLYIFQNTISDQVGTPQNRRELPSGLDLMAALGSSAALKALEDAGALNFENFNEQMLWLQSTIGSTEEVEWIDSTYSIWMYTLLAQAEVKQNIYPAYMQSENWAFKDLNSGLGSWVELNHDSDASSEPMEVRASDDSTDSRPAPGYVEPNPLVFFRLSFLAKSVAAGLKERGMPGSPANGAVDLNDLIQDLEKLGNQFEQLGEIALKELQGIPLIDADFQIIHTPLGRFEERFIESIITKNMDLAESPGLPYTPVISTLNREKSYLLHLATGLVDRIFTIVPVNGDLAVAQGGVYSYYEFSHPKTEQLNDRSWRLLLSASPPTMPAWSDSLLLPGGYPLDILAFRKGDVYRVTNRASNLKLYQQPDIASELISGINFGETVQIIDGPVRVGSETWWKFEVVSDDQKGSQGWSSEYPEWFQRVWIGS